ncbi:hypothetical protein LTR66_004346 [Elasticomyces elasticus]|nr:hypothetical protein LTR66_004346 [Elasticomyces elasticus]
MDIVSWTLGNEDAYPQDLPILIDAINPARSLSAEQVRSTVKKLIAGFRAAGVRPGHTIDVHIFNDIIYPAIFLAIVGAGCRFAGSNPSYKANELAHHFKTSDTKFVITGPAQLSTVLDAAGEADVPRSHIWVIDCDDSDGSGVQCFENLLQRGEHEWITIVNEEASKSNIATLLSTSGTTGFPKMAARTHFAHISEATAIASDNGKPYQVRRLLAAPFFHGFAMPLALLDCVRSGHQTYVMGRWNQGVAFRAIRDFQITETAVTPPVILGLLLMPEDERRALKNLKLIWCGGACLDPMTQNKALEMFALEARIVQVWGMTEGGWFTTFRHPESDSTGSVGRALAGLEVKVVDDAGRRLNEDGARGEILVKGPHIMKEYLGNAEATSDAFDVEGWLKTGDVGCCRQGKIYVVDRKKELIKTNGWQVAPAELEAVLLRHPSIADAGVVGVQPPGMTTEVPRAYIVLNKNQHFRHETENDDLEDVEHKEDDELQRRQRLDSAGSVSQDDIRTYLLTQLSSLKVSRCEVRPIEEIPKSASGKILRKELRRIADEGVVLTE